MPSNLRTQQDAILKALYTWHFQGHPMPLPHGDPRGATPPRKLAHVPLGLLDAELADPQEPALQILISKGLAQKVSHPVYPSGTFSISGHEVAIEIPALAQDVRTPKGVLRERRLTPGFAWPIRCEVKIDDQPEAFAPEAFTTRRVQKIDWQPYTCFKLTAKGIEAAESLYQREEESKSTGQGDGVTPAEGDGVGLKPAATIPTDAESKEFRRHEWLAKALFAVHAHPGWSDARISRLVGVSPSTVSRSEVYQTAAGIARKKIDLPSGHVAVDPDTGSRSLEAYSDDGDPAKMDWDDK